jgi:hypothetical protein
MLNLENLKEAKIWQQQLHKFYFNVHIVRYSYTHDLAHRSFVRIKYKYAFMHSHLPLFPSWRSFTTGSLSDWNLYLLCRKRDWTVESCASLLGDFYELIADHLKLCCVLAQQPDTCSLYHLFLPRFIISIIKIDKESLKGFLGKKLLPFCYTFHDSYAYSLSHISYSEPA